MPSTYPARIRGGRLEWVGATPKEIADSESLDVWITVVDRDRPSTGEDTESSGDREDEIGKLYDELAALAAQDRQPASDQRIEAVWARLRELQAQEAQRQHEAFEASLAMPIDAGARILGMAEALRRDKRDP